VWGRSWPCAWGCPVYPYCQPTAQGFGFCQIGPFGGEGGSGLLCLTDADCAQYAVCQADGFCGGEACQTDPDCEAVIGPGRGACVQNDCPSSPGNFCTLVCSYAP
jgi:hypothetical protein